MELVFIKNIKKENDTFIICCSNNKKIKSKEIPNGKRFFFFEKGEQVLNESDFLGLDKDVSKRLKIECAGDGVIVPVEVIDHICPPSCTNWKDALSKKISNNFVSGGSYHNGSNGYYGHNYNPNAVVNINQTAAQSSVQSSYTSAPKKKQISIDDSVIFGHVSNFSNNEDLELEKAFKLGTDDGRYIIKEVPIGISVLFIKDSNNIIRIIYDYSTLGTTFGTDVMEFDFASEFNLKELADAMSTSTYDPLLINATLIGPGIKQNPHKLNEYKLVINFVTINKHTILFTKEYKHSRIVNPVFADDYSRKNKSIKDLMKLTKTSKINPGEETIGFMAYRTAPFQNLGRAKLFFLRKNKV